MAESRAEQVAFEWAVQGGEAREAQPEPSAKPARRRLAPKTEVPTAETAPAARPATPNPAALPPDNELWDVHGAARFLKRSVSWVYHRAEDGSLPVRRLGGWGVRFIPAELRAWVEEGGGRRGR